MRTRRPEPPARPRPSPEPTPEPPPAPGPLPSPPRIPPLPNDGRRRHRARGGERGDDPRSRRRLRTGGTVLPRRATREVEPLGHRPRERVRDDPRGVGVASRGLVERRSRGRGGRGGRGRCLVPPATVTTVTILRLRRSQRPGLRELVSLRRAMKRRAGRDQQRGPRAERRRPRVGTASPVRRRERRLVRGVERRRRRRGFAGGPAGWRALASASERAQHSFQRVQGPFLLHAAPRHEPRVRRVHPVRESRSRRRRGGRKPRTVSRSRGVGELRSRRLRRETPGDDGPPDGLPGRASKRQPGGEGPNVRLERGERRGLLRVGYVRADSFRPGRVLLVPYRFRITPKSDRGGR